jgi:hypothetical protein
VISLACDSSRISRLGFTIETVTLFRMPPYWSLHWKRQTSPRLLLHHRTSSTTGGFELTEAVFDHSILNGVAVNYGVRGIAYLVDPVTGNLSDTVTIIFTPVTGTELIRLVTITMDSNPTTGIRWVRRPVGRFPQFVLKI